MFTLEELYSIKSQDYFILQSAKHKIDRMIEQLEEKSRILPWVKYANVCSNDRDWDYQTIENFFDDDSRLIDTDYNNINVEQISNFVKENPDEYFVFSDFDPEGHYYFYVVSKNGLVLSGRNKFVQITENDLRIGYISWKRWKDYNWAGMDE